MERYADWLAKYTASIRFLIPALSRGWAVVQSSDNAVMSGFMTNWPKPVSAARTMTECFNEHTSATCHLDSLEVSLRNANDIAL